MESNQGDKVDDQAKHITQQDSPSNWQLISNSKPDN